MLKKLNLFFCISSLVWIGCSGAPSMTMTEYRITIGTATLDDFLVISNKILNRQRIVIDRTEDRGMSAVIECKYEYPELSNEEALQDIKEIKYQLILEARAKGGTGVRMYSVRGTVRSYGRFGGSEEWVDIPANENTKRRIKLLANELKTEFESKIRAF
jgi:hypothetical protein|tara:strand:+ start:5126 stop:5602 length:477 start_codon:yes stop_codon:yes gene_type:complete